VALAVARLLLGWVFLWASLDKAFGLGIETPPQESRLAGASPTEGYLASLGGRFAGLLHAIAGQVWVDCAFILVMLSVGVALMTGVALRLAAVGAVGPTGSLWLTSVPVENNPVVDEHLVYVRPASESLLAIVDSD
jgi:thiosulfate dehydrogenase (quinone) large subunit